GILEVHRLPDALIRPEIRHPRLVEPGPQLLPPVARNGDRNVLDGADRLDAGLQAQPGEVEEAEQRLVAEVKEEVRRPLVVPVLDQLHQRKLEQVLIELDRALNVGTYQRSVMDASPRSRLTFRGRT